MRIGELSQACDCPVETVRYYEKIGLLPQAARLENGYRSYENMHLKWLRVSDFVEYSVIICRHALTRFVSAMRTGNY